MSKWERSIEITSKLFGYIGGFAVAAMAVNVLLDATLRTLFNAPIAGTLEYVQYWWMIIIGFAGWALASYTGEHIDAPIIGDRLTPRLKLVWQIIVQTFTLLFLGLVGYFTWQAAVHAFTIQEYVGGNETLIWPMRFVLPISSLLFALVVLTKMVNTIRTLAKWSPEDDNAPDKQVNLSAAV